MLRTLQSTFAIVSALLAAVSASAQAPAAGTSGTGVAGTGTSGAGTSGAGTAPAQPAQPPAMQPPAMQPPPPPPMQIGDPVTFVACPTYRDTDAGRKSGCWLADDPGDGTTYDVSFGLVKPQVGQAVLVEGIPTDAPSTLCGGVVLQPVRTSTLPDACPRSIIPAEDFPGRPYKSPPEQLKPASEPRTLPPGPYDTKEFTIYFEFGRDFLMYQYSELILEKISLYVKASQARQIRIEGFAATRAITVRNGSSLPGNTRQLREDYALARARAEMVAEALRRLGVAANTIGVEARGAPAATADAELGKLPEVTKRRVVVTVVP